MREQRWIGALVGRCLFYGAGMAMYFLGFGLLVWLVSVLLFWMLGFPAESFGTLVSWLRWVFWCVALIGTVGGVVAGFCSPRRDVGRRFFWRVLQSGSTGLRNGLIFGVTCGVLGGLVVNWLGAESIGVQVGIFISVAVVALGQIYGMWRGIHLALRERQQQEQQAELL